GGLCSRVDQIGCGGGIVNTSSPQTGHNKVAKVGDTTDPGADCCYNGQPASECLGGVNLNDDPAPLTCTTTGAGNDYAGKIVKTVGGGAADAPGIHFRYTVPELSTTWTDSQSPPGKCADGSTAALRRPDRLGRGGGEGRLVGPDLADQGHRVRRDHAADAGRVGGSSELQLHRGAGFSGVAGV